MKSKLKMIDSNISQKECDIPAFPDVSRPMKGYEVERSTLIELEILLKGLSERYKNELRRLMTNHRLISSSLITMQMNTQYLETEIVFNKEHISNLFGLYRQSHQEAMMIRRQIERCAGKL